MTITQPFSKLKDIFDSEPTKINMQAGRDKWKQIGPFKFEDYILENKIKLDTKLQVKEVAGYHGQFNQVEAKHGIGRYQFATGLFEG